MRAAIYLICLLLTLLTFGFESPLAFSGEKIVQGPPWHTSYKQARREAKRKGCPVFIYYTKTF